MERIRLSNSAPRAVAGATRAHVAQGASFPSAIPAARGVQGHPCQELPIGLRASAFFKRKMRTHLSPQKNTSTNAGQPGGNTDPPPNPLLTEIRSKAALGVSTPGCSVWTTPSLKGLQVRVQSLASQHHHGGQGCTAHLWVALQGQPCSFLVLRP